VESSKCVPSIKCRTVDLDAHFFRREAGRLLATLTRILGVHNLSLAEDVVQDTLLSALERWKFSGVPEHY
jgi:predicted RNA polymerase sigma factor